MAETLPQAVPGGLDTPTKGKIKTWVLKLRDLLEKDFATQLRRYGIEPSKLSKEPPTYLSDEEKQRRKVICATTRKEAANEGDLAKAVEAYIREAAFTYTNRLVGLKCMETRGILFVGGESTEAITTRPEFGGRSRLLWTLRSDDRTYRQGPGSEERLWRDGLVRAFEAVTKDIRVLFDPKHEYSQLFPTHRTLMDGVGLINGLDAECGRTSETGSVFASPDFLGWVYQFFSAEEKEQIRAETRGTPRTSHELGVINQFYTPDWIVKFLVDNTLGRVWLQMHPDTRLYHREPGEKLTGGANIDYLVPQTGEDERIALKPVGEMKLLDPACGTMHFGQYAFHLFYAMYLEEQEKAGQPGWPEQPSVANPADIPATILANNLYGIDIDARAVQIAALSLLLTAKQEAQDHGLDPRLVGVVQMNLVIADAVNLGPDERDKFVRRLDPWEFGGIEPMRRAVDALWKSLDHVAELGSLVQPGEDVERALSTPVTHRTELATPIQPRLGDGVEWGIQQPELASEQHATAREYLLDKLQEFAAKNGGTDINQRLFAQETEKGLMLLGVLRNMYDAVVMNPPYGAFAQSVEGAVRNALWHGKNDIYCAFVEHFARTRLSPSGYVGALTSRTFIRLIDYKPFREEVLLSGSPLRCLVDLGWGVLDDALNETAAYVVSGRADAAATGWFLRLNDVGDKNRVFEAAVQGQDPDGRLFRVPLAQFKWITASPLCYWASEELRLRFGELPPLQPRYAHAGMGACVPREQFVRYHWEVIPVAPGTPGQWFPFANGGYYSPFYRDNIQIANWADDGAAVKAEVLRRYPYLNGNYGFVIQSERYYFCEGITWGKRHEFFNPQYLPSGHVFSDEGQSLFPSAPETVWSLLGYLNSSTVCYFLTLTAGVHKHRMYVRRIPVAEFGIEAEALAASASSAHDAKLAWQRGNEISTVFQRPWVLGDGTPPRGGRLADAIEDVLAREQLLERQCHHAQKAVDSIVYSLFDMSAVDIGFVESEMARRPNDVLWNDMAEATPAAKRREHVHRLLSYTVKTLVEQDDDGIVPLVPCGDEQPLIQRARGLLDEWFGTERGHTIESEINNELGARKTMESWFAKDYLKYHVSLYKKRPIFWHITAADGSFGVIVHYHRFNHDRLDRLRSHYLFNHIQRLQSAIGVARADTSPGGRDQLLTLEQNLEAARALDEKLRQIAEGDGYRIQVPWKSEAEQPKGWDPDLDDGVKVNIGPFQKAGVLAVRKVV